MSWLCLDTVNSNYLVPSNKLNPQFSALTSHTGVNEIIFHFKRQPLVELNAQVGSAHPRDPYSPSGGLAP